MATGTHQVQTYYFENRNFAAAAEHALSSDPKSTCHRDKTTQDRMEEPLERMAGESRSRHITYR